MANQITSPEQRLFLRLIIQGSDTWDKRSLLQIMKELKVDPSIIPTSNPVEPAEGWYPRCIGCGRKVHDKPIPYPVLEERCPSCNPKPLALFNGEHVWRGVAKLAYIEYAIHFPTIKERSIAIHEALSR